MSMPGMVEERRMLSTWDADTVEEGEGGEGARGRV